MVLNLRAKVHKKNVKKECLSRYYGKNSIIRALSSLPSQKPPLQRLATGAFGLPSQPEPPRGSGLFFVGKHGVPSGQTDRFLLQNIEHLGRYVFLVGYHPEHVFLEPTVGHDEMSVIS